MKKRVLWSVSKFERENDDRKTINHQTNSSSFPPDFFGGKLSARPWNTTKLGKGDVDDDQEVRHGQGDRRAKSLGPSPIIFLLM